MISIKTTIVLIMAVSSILGLAPMAALAQLSQDATIDDRDFNAQANFADVDLAQGDGDGNSQASGVGQSNSLSDDDQNSIEQFIAN
jgi:hypothetical protein